MHLKVSKKTPIEVCSRCGCNSVKIQNFSPRKFIFLKRLVVPRTVSFYRNRAEISGDFGYCNLKTGSCRVI